MIEADGPMPVSLYMQTCLHDPTHGYYATRPGLGEDFTTAPETSQIFGELLGLWLLHEWQNMGSPSAFTLAEPGPGRATLMLDALRAINKAASGAAFLKAMSLVFVEASPALRELQSDRLSGFKLSFVTQLEDLHLQPTLIIANEFLDCLPVRQFIRQGNSWLERKIGVEGDTLIWGVDPVDGAPVAEAVSSVDALEVQPGLESFAMTLEGLAANGNPVRALLIDYGPNGLPPSDTLRAFRLGKQVDPLCDPGMCDLTVDVDFAWLRTKAINLGLAASPVTEQGRFLMALGAEARMQQLVKAHPERADEMYETAARLIDPAQMGSRFKVICLSSADLPPPAGFAS